MRVCGVRTLEITAGGRASEPSKSRTLPLQERGDSQESGGGARTEEILEDFLALLDQTAAAPINEERPKALANVRGQHPLEVLQRRPSKLPVVGVKAPERDLKRFAGQHQREQREHMGQTLARPIAHKLVQWGFAQFAHEAVE